MAVTKKAGLRHLCSSFASLVLRVLCLLHIFFSIVSQGTYCKWLHHACPSSQSWQEEQTKNFNLIFNKILCTERLKKNLRGQLTKEQNRTEMML